MFNQNQILILLWSCDGLTTLLQYCWIKKANIQKLKDSKRNFLWHCGVAQDVSSSLLNVIDKKKLMTSKDFFGLPKTSSNFQRVPREFLGFLREFLWFLRKILILPRMLSQDFLEWSPHGLLTFIRHYVSDSQFINFCLWFVKHKIKTFKIIKYLFCSL